MTIRERIGHSITLLSGMALGAGMMYILDPVRGTARRAYARDKLVRGVHLLRCQLNKQARNLGNRVVGTVAETGSSIRDRFRTIDDTVLLERVRAQIGHVVSHPALIDVVPRNGKVTIIGDVLEGEQEKIGRCLAKVRGVRDFKLELNEHSPAELDRLSGARGWREAI